MKISINLLPENRKDLMAKKKKFRDIVKQELLFALPVLVFVLMLLSVNVILRIQNSAMDTLNTDSGLQGEYKDVKAYENQAKSTNEKIANIRKFKDAHFMWSLVIEKLIQSVPEGVSLRDFSSTNYKITMTGVAKSRENLIVLEENLESLNCFENINVPLSNLVVKNDIDFQVDFDIKKECLMGK